MTSSKPLESLLLSIVRAVLAGQPFSHHLIVLVAADALAGVAQIKPGAEAH